MRSPILDGDDEHSTRKCEHHHRDRLWPLARGTHAGFIRRRSTLLVREVTQEWELGLRLGDAPFHDGISSALGVCSRSERHDQQSHKHGGREHICSFHSSTSLRLDRARQAIAGRLSRKIIMLYWTVVQCPRAARAIAAGLSDAGVFVGPNPTLPIRTKN